MDIKSYELITCLKKFDFDASHQKSNYHVHGLSDYPARMHPYVTKVLIEQLTSPDSIVYDPYCGSGTVLVESMLSGNHSIGADINPLASLMTKVKTTPIDPIQLDIVFSKITTDLKKAGPGHFCDELPFDNDAINLTYWFKPWTIKRLSIIFHFLTSHWLDFGNEVVDFLRISFARLVREVSTLRKDEFKLYREPDFKIRQNRTRVFFEFIRILKDNIVRMKEFYKVVQSKNLVEYRPKVFNIRNDLLKLNNVDLVITSPPYGDNPTTVTYGQFSRYPLLWLGFSKEDAYALDKLPRAGEHHAECMKKLLELSPTYRKVVNNIRSKDLKRVVAVEDFFISLLSSLGTITQSLAGDGKMCIIIGSRTVRNIIVPNYKIVQELAPLLSLKHIHNIERNISSKRLPARNSLGNTILKEKVMLFEKG